MLRPNLDSPLIGLRKVYALVSLLAFLIQYLRGQTWTHWGGLNLALVQGDYTYWLLRLSHLDPFWRQGFSDGLFLVLAWLGYVFPQKNYLGPCLGLAWLAYALSYNLTGMHLTHIWFPLGFLGLALGPSLGLTWLRYYAAWAMFSAFCWKLSRGSVFHYPQLALILQGQDNLGWLGFYLMGRPTWAYVFWLGACFLEASFVLAFFTRRFDGILGVLLLIFVCMDYLVMGLHFWPWLAFLPAFFSPNCKDLNCLSVKR